MFFNVKFCLSVRIFSCKVILKLMVVSCNNSDKLQIFTFTEHSLLLIRNSATSLYALALYPTLFQLDHQVSPPEPSSLAFLITFYIRSVLILVVNRMFVYFVKYLVIVNFIYWNQLVLLQFKSQKLLLVVANGE